MGTKKDRERERYCNSHADISLSIFLFQKMSSFPPKKWEVRFLRDMQTLACETVESGEISMVVKPAGREEGSFRFVLAGPSKLKV